MTDDSYLTPEELAGLERTFQVQTREMLVEYGALVLKLERSRNIAEPLRALERTVHTIKGDSMALGFDRLSKLAHELEDLFRSLRGQALVGRDNVDQLLAAGDVMNQLLAAYCERATPLPDVESLCRRLRQRASGSDDSAPTPADSYRLTIWFARDCRMHSAGALLVRRRLEELAKVVAVIPDPDSPAFEQISKFSIDVESSATPRQVRDAARVPGVTSRVMVKEPPPGRNEPEADSKSPDVDRIHKLTPGQSMGGGWLRVEVSRVDRIMNLVGELVIARSMVAQAQTDLETRESHPAAAGRLADAHTLLERTLRDLQAAVLNIRMVPVDHVFRRFPRVVRDLANSEGKQVELEVRGGITELDKTIVDALGEPLLHLVRNAIDHGLETPAERERSGKPRCGRLVLQSFYEGNHVHIVVEDDGRGIDAAKVAEKARRLGLDDRDRLDLSGESEILDIIYRPGFTTRETVSDVSGRGIGMDVVRESIENLKGVIELTTAPGKGTRFLIRLPVTLAILRAILVGVDESVFAIPLTGVLEIVRLHGGEAATMLGRGVLPWREKVVPLVSLRKALGLNGSTAENFSTRSGEAETPNGFVLLVGEAERRIGLVAERLLGEQELVVKPIDDSLTRSPGIAGASILGDGRIVLILHIRGLLEKHVSLARSVEVLH
ncbi:MAG TPA: chemotaxis protein CheA [Vicinamibacteria bacterium]|nr:chemotaxis protein CheA [Vicinamibacteria bacterium]